MKEPTLPIYCVNSPQTAAQVATAVKKPKLEAGAVKDEQVDGGADAALEATLAAQNKEFFRFRDLCEKHLTKKDLAALLERNRQQLPEGTYKMLDACADLLCFGALARCTECGGGGQLVFSKSAYVCTGSVSEWVKCDNVVREPKRTVAKVPKHLADQHAFLAAKLRVQARAVRYVAPTVATATTASLGGLKKEEASAEGPRIKRQRPALYNLEFAVVGRLSGARPALKAAIERLGGKLVSKVHEHLAAVIASEKEVEKMSEKMTEVKSWGVHVVKETFVDELEEGKTGIDYIKEHAICDWGTDVRWFCVHPYGDIYI